MAKKNTGFLLRGRILRGTKSEKRRKRARLRLFLIFFKVCSFPNICHFLYKLFSFLSTKKTGNGKNSTCKNRNAPLKIAYTDAFRNAVIEK